MADGFEIQMGKHVKACFTLSPVLRNRKKNRFTPAEPPDYLQESSVPENAGPSSGLRGSVGFLVGIVGRLDLGRVL